MIAKGEKEQLNRSFSVYELFYYTITTIAYICTMILIVPFVKVYTINITDADYIRPVFGVLLVIAEFVWAIRLPYSTITLAAGHFKQTRKGAWIEAISNILISLALVWKFGIVGVAIGTLIAMIIRTVEFIYHTNKYILEREHSKSIKRILIVIVEVIIVYLACKVLPQMEMVSYTNLLIYSCMVGIASLLIVLPVNLILYREDTKRLVSIAKRNLLKRK